MSDIETLREQIENGPFLASGKVDYTRSQEVQKPFYIDNMRHLNFGYGYDYKAHGATGLRSFLPQETLDLADRVQRKGKGVAFLNQALERLKGKDFDWRLMARQLEESTAADIRDKLATLLLNGKDAKGERGSAHVDRAYNVGPNDFSRIGISLLNDVARNDLAGAAYELAGNTVTEKFDFGLGPERRAMVEAMVLLGFDVELDRNNDIGKLSGNVSAGAISSFLTQMNSSETGRHWLSSQDVGRSLLHALGEWSFSQDAGQSLFQAGGEFNRTHQGNAPSAGQAPTAGSTDSISPMLANFSGSGPRLDGATLDRATRSIAKLGAAPVRHHEGDAAERVSQAGGPRAAAPGSGAGYLAHPQGISPGAAVGPAGGAMHPAAGHDAGGTKDEGARQRSRGAAARSQAAARATVQAAAAQIARQARVDMRAGEELDLASFAALGGPSHLDVAVAAGLGQMALTMRAAALRLPDRVARMAAGAGPGTAMTAHRSYVPDWDAAMWTQSGPGLAQLAASGAAGESLAWLTPMQGPPAAPRAIPAAAGAERVEPSFPEQSRGEPFASLLRPRAADTWAGPAGTPRPVAASENVATFADFGASDGASRRTLDEMAWLASRPPVGITGFDAGQMPAWLGGWTGVA